MSAALLLGQASSTQLADYFTKEFRRGREIKKAISLGSVSLVDFCKRRGKALKSRRVLKIALDIVNALQEPIPNSRLNWAGSKLLYVPRELIAKAIFGEGRRSIAYNRKLLRQQASCSQVV